MTDLEQALEAAGGIGYHLAAGSKAGELLDALIAELEARIADKVDDTEAANDDQAQERRHLMDRVL